MAPEPRGREEYEIPDHLGFSRPDGDTGRPGFASRDRGADHFRPAPLDGGESRFGYAPPSEGARASAGRSDLAPPDPVSGHPDLEPVDGLGFARHRAYGRLDVDPQHPKPELPAAEAPRSSSASLTTRLPAVPALPSSIDSALADGPGAELVLSSDESAPALHRGRAARRRQMERWKKNRRRAAAATAVALFGGGLTIAAMPSHSSKGGAPMAAAPEPGSSTSLHTDNTASAPPTAQAAPRTPAHARPPGAARPSTPASTAGVTRTPRHARPAATTPAAPVAAAPSNATQASFTKQQPAPAPVASDPAPAPAPSTAPTTTPTTSPTTPPPVTSPTTTPPPTHQLCVLILCLG